MKLFLIAGLLSASFAMAHPVKQASTYSANQDGDITNFVEEVATPDDVYAYEACPVKEYSTDSVSETGVIIDEIINIGGKIWTIVEKGKPVLTSSYTYANALPKGVRGAAELDGFSSLQAKSFRRYGKNPYGITVYDVTYTLVHRYGGTYQGRGRYLDQVAVLPTHISLMWGYHLSYGVTNISTVNIGTREAPVAGLTMELVLKVTTVIKAMEVRGLYDFHADKAEVIAVQ